MSRQLLENLNGSQRGLLRRWLDQNPREPRMAWYPSAGMDMRDLFFLHPDYSNIVPATGEEPVAPELFVHTDYLGGGQERFLDSSLIYRDDRTSVTISEIEELPHLNLPLYDDMVAFPDGSDATHRVLFMVIDVQCLKLGHFQRPVLYAFVENAAFCAKKLIPLEARFSHLVQVRYGHSFGGGRASPGWLRYQLNTLGVEVLVSDGAEQRDTDSHRVFNRFPNLEGAETSLHSWQRFRSLPQRAWDGYGGVSWWSKP